MPGAQDGWGQLTEPGMRNREAAFTDLQQGADRPERGSLADLRHRLERLPPGHPSSPYNDDLTRKPPVARLKDLELPFHDTNGAVRHHDTEPGPEAPAETGRGNGAAGNGGDGGGPQGYGSNGNGSAGHAAATEEPGSAGNGLGTANGVATAEWPGAADGPGAADQFSRTDRLGPGDEFAPHEEFGVDDEFADDEFSAGDDAGSAGSSSAAGGFMADGYGGDGPGRPEPSGGADGWLSASTWGVAETLSHPVVDPAGDLVDERPRIGPDGSWEWRGRYLTQREYHIAEEALGRCRIAEGRNVFGGYGHSGLTPAMRRIEAQLDSGALLPDTENRALKPPDSFRERFADLILRHPDKPTDELALEVHDGIRYAFIFDTENYAEATLQAHSRLKGHGFELEARWNGWESREFKGINSRWRDPAHDLVFEVQFHTAPSWEAWERFHDAYRRITDPRTPPADRARLRAVHAEASARVPVPPRCTAIPDFRKEVP